ncbi:WecB/TagA/CpsF family glycosyltransferase [Runella limosa]|uniref:WecB/TagA/CpsF family glycosyltransferase n=1 Tax=Runella limosa TaxID=370978 RepID=UPI0003F61F78|nr:WecB/TagA/CpsF family glycosyltransferase [Runella limosa]
MSFSTVTILGVRFFAGQVEDVFKQLENHGGLLTAPAAPNLADILKEQDYYNALYNSDIVIPDSGYMVLIWNWILRREPIQKISGLKFINFFLQHISTSPKKIFLVNPSNEEGEANRLLLHKKGARISDTCMYTAPIYSKQVDDHKLLELVEINQPHWILINIGGGVQEKLGLYLRQNLSFKPAIICTGAAIAFKTGKQVPIPAWIDRLYLGWLARCVSNPRLYIKRYLKSFYLLMILIRYKEKAPYKSARKIGILNA